MHFLKQSQARGTDVVISVQAQQGMTRNTLDLRRINQRLYRLACGARSLSLVVLSSSDLFATVERAVRGRASNFCALRATNAQRQLPRPRPARARMDPGFDCTHGVLPAKKRVATAYAGLCRQKSGLADARGLRLAKASRSVHRHPGLGGG